MGTPGVPLSKVEILEAIFLKKGIIKHASESLGCDPSTIYNWMGNDKEIKDAVDNARKAAAEERIDRNEILRKKAYDAAEYLLDQNDGTQTIFTLKALCGWGEGKTEHSITITKVDRPYNDQANTNSSQISM